MYTKMLSLRFPPSAVNEPVVSNLIRKFDLSCNILKAVIYPRKEGMVVMELSGHRKSFLKGLRYLKTMGVKVESIGQDIKRDEVKCFQCGACTAVCPTGALH
ncbi:MAG: 4Fe-4S binding protein, partial [Proteobacteria bacterium]|nr:4Fe-4S binding protein [Pseudomonadota bacterium]